MATLLFGSTRSALAISADIRRIVLPASAIVGFSAVCGNKVHLHIRPAGTPQGSREVLLRQENQPKPIRDMFSNSLCPGNSQPDPFDLTALTSIG
jgi:hypothetical protein